MQLEQAERVKAGGWTWAYRAPPASKVALGVGVAGATEPRAGPGLGGKTNRATTGAWVTCAEVEQEGEAAG